MATMHELDRKIIDLLTDDSRLSYREIAKKLGVSHANIATRVRQLEKNHIIKGYTTVLDPEFMDLYPLCIRITAQAGYDYSMIGRYISDLDEVNVVLRVAGDCDLLALAWCKDRKEALSLITKISKIQGIEKVESHVVLETIKLLGKKLK